MAVTEPDPADACRQSLEFDPRLCQVETVVQMGVVRHQFLDLGIGAENVLRIARQRRPAKGTDPAAEQWTDIGGYEAWKIEGVFFFQAEDGIRDLTVTGVQTCALPI